MRLFVTALLVVAVAACGPRRVEVTSNPSPAAADAAVHVTNSLSQAVNVYVVNAGTDMFLKQVAANSAEHLPVRGVAPGTTVTLRATTVDGTRTFSRDRVVLTSMYAFNVP